MGKELNASLAVFSTSPLRVILLSSAALLVWLICLAVYRLYFSPIAHIPGPKLAALTQWYETYYDVHLGGQFTLHQQELHEKYGPIIRINPWEVHINDPEFYETIHSTTSRFDKVPEHEWWGNSPTAAQSTVSHEQHRIRRGAQSSFFSKRQILNFTPEIQARADKLCNRLNLEYKNTRTILQMNAILGCFSADIVTEYAFAKDYRYLDSPDFQARFVKTMQLTVTVWTLSSTPENQLTNFQSDVNKGESLVVMHYLYSSTVNYLPQFVAIAQKTGKQLMRVDQCLEDPNAPPL